MPYTAGITPAQSFDHKLNPVKGWPGPWALDKAVGLDVSVTAARALPGRVAYQDPTTGKFKLGVGTITSISAPMAYFLFNGAADNDAVGYHGNLTGVTATGYAPLLMGLAASGGYELESTEYVSTTYSSGDLLTGVVTDDATQGQLTKVANNTNKTIIVGVVSDGLMPHADKPGSFVLRFHTHFQAAWRTS